MEDRFFNLKFRPSLGPIHPLPLNARSVGHCCKGPEYVDTPPHKNFVHLLWSIDGEGEVLMGNDFLPFPADHVACYLSNQPRCWRAKSNPWRVRWVTIDGVQADIVFGFFKIPQKPHRVGACPEHLFDKLENEILKITPQSERNASALVYQILCSAMGTVAEKPAGCAFSDKCIELIRGNLTNPQLNVDWLANRLKKDRSVLSRLFKQETGMTPVKYISALRLQHALSLLRTEEMNVYEIAAQCGYAETGYFCRVFKNQMHMSPAVFRRKQQD